MYFINLPKDIKKLIMMKRIIFLLVIVFAVNVAYAQKSKRTTAYNYLRNNNLAKAMENIEPTITNEKTMADAKTWYYRGTIYLQIAMSTDPEVKALSEDALNIAYESYIKAKELDEKGLYTTDINNNLKVIVQEFYRIGVEKFNQNDFLGAADFLEKTFKISESFGILDSASAYYTAYAYQAGKDYENARKYYNMLIEADYKKPVMYASMAEMYKAEADTATALEIIKAGREKFPKNFDLLIAETNIYLSRGDTKNALDNLETALEQDTTNPSIYFAIGTNYENLEEYDEAENAYKQAIRLNPEYFDAFYNLGALYVNRAAAILDSANALPLEETEKYDKMKAEADAYLKESIPHLERALEINPNDRTTIVSLREIYARLNMTEKLNEIKEMMKK